MSRKIMLAAVPAMALVLTLCVADNSSSQAFAKEIRGGHGPVQNHRGYGRYFRYSDRYSFGYPSYGCYGYQAPVCEVVAPVCTTCEPIVTPVCPTCEPSYVGVDYGFWGYRHIRNHYENPGRFHPLASRGSAGRRG
jgi:hypothetical protein